MSSLEKRMTFSISSDELLYINVLILSSEKARKNENVLIPPPLLPLYMKRRQSLQKKAQPSLRPENVLGPQRQDRHMGDL